MNKKLLLAGAVAVAGFFTLTAFDGKTLVQQKADIASAVTAQLETLRAEKAAECDARVQTEVDTRIAAWEEEMAAAPVKGAVKKKGSGKGPKVDPLPVKPPPTDPAQAKKDKTSGTPTTNTEEKKSKTAGEAPASNTDKKKSKTAGGGGNR